MELRIKGAIRQSIRYQDFLAGAVREGSGNTSLRGLMEVQSSYQKERHEAGDGVPGRGVCRRCPKSGLERVIGLDDPAGPRGVLSGAKLVQELEEEADVLRVEIFEPQTTVLLGGNRLWSIQPGNLLHCIQWHLSRT